MDTIGFFYGGAGLSMGLRLLFFYVVVYGSSGGSIMWVLGLGNFGGVRVEA